MNASFIPALLNFALPLATAYAEEQEAMVLRDGVALTPEQCDDARRVGVKNPERVRILKVAAIPVPKELVLAKANAYVGMIGPQSTTLNFGYAIFIREDRWADRTALVHELVHVAQGERLGGINEFVKTFLKECLTVGHANSPLEREAVELTKKVCG